jgi:predicted small secreted protein
LLRMHCASPETQLERPGHSGQAWMRHPPQAARLDLLLRRDVRLPADPQSLPRDDLRLGVERNSRVCRNLFFFGSAKRILLLIESPPPAPANCIASIVQSGWAKVVRRGTQAWNALLGRTAPVAESVVETAKNIASGVGQAIRSFGHKVAKAARRGWMLASVLTAMARQYRFHLATSLAIGCVIGLACWLGGREVASVGCGLSGFAGTLATRVLPRRHSDYLANFQS